MVEFNQNEDAYLLLKKMYTGWFNKDLDYKFNVEQYSRKKQAEQLAKIFNSHF